MKIKFNLVLHKRLNFFGLNNFELKDREKFYMNILLIKIISKMASPVTSFQAKFLAPKKRENLH